DSHHDRALDLVAQSIRIHNRPTIPGLDHTHNTQIARSRIDFDLRASGDISSFLEASGNTEALPGGGLLLSPSEAFGGGFEDGAQPRLAKVLQPKFEWIHCNAVRQFVH